LGVVEARLLVKLGRPLRFDLVLAIFICKLLSGHPLRRYVEGLFSVARILEMSPRVWRARTMCETRKRKAEVSFS
jgi:hypothetical protein